MVHLCVGLTMDAWRGTVVRVARWRHSLHASTPCAGICMKRAPPILLLCAALVLVAALAQAEGAPPVGVPPVGARSHGPALQGVSETIAIPIGREARTMALLGDVGFDRPTGDGLVWRNIAIAQAQVTFALSRVQTKQRVGEIVVKHRDMAAPGDRLGREFALKIRVLDPNPAVVVALDAGAASILSRDTGGYFAVVGQPSPAPLLWTAFGAMVAWAGLLLASQLRNRQQKRVNLRFKATHLLPALIQLVLYGYWSSQVSEVYGQLPRIAIQLVFAFALDALLGLTLRRQWDLTFGPVPIVLSTNLFVWFPPGAFHLSLAVIALAIASKWLLQRQGRHVFNPSAFGIAVVGAACIAMPNVARFQDIAHLISEPRWMLALIVGLGLIAQLRVPIVLITLSSSAVLLGLKAVGAYHVVYPFWPAILLALTLLATDPATVPQTSLGKLFYGLSFGLLVWATSAVLTLCGESDFFGKVLPMPLVNMLVPQFDRAGDWLAARLVRRAQWLVQALEPRWNWAHVAIWAALAGAHAVR